MLAWCRLVSSGADFSEQADNFYNVVQCSIVGAETPNNKLLEIPKIDSLSLSGTHALEVYSVSVVCNCLNHLFECFYNIFEDLYIDKLWTDGHNPIA